MGFTSNPGGIEGQFIVDLRLDSIPPGNAEAIDAKVEELVRRYGGEVLYIYRDTVPGYLVRMSVKNAIALASDADVEDVEQDQPSLLATVGSWGLDRIDQTPTGPVFDQKFNPPNDGSGVDVYVLDTGVERHPDFGGRVQVGKSFISGQSANDDCDNHGTLVAGIVGSKTFGVAKAVRIIPVKVWCRYTGSAGTMANGVDWVTAQARKSGKPSVANMSIVVRNSTALNKRVAASASVGVMYVVAAGNENDNACNWSPASSKNVLTVGATTRRDNRLSQTNYGACIKIFAPGFEIVSVGAGNQVTQKSGTSVASPHVAGAAAIYLAANPGALPPKVKKAIIDSALSGVVGNTAGSSDALLNIHKLV